MTFDLNVQIGVDDLGQSTITCLGELHLELCLKALSEKFAKYVQRAAYYNFHITLLK
jgi:hypothetical protein